MLVLLNLVVLITFYIVRECTLPNDATDSHDPDRKRFIARAYRANAWCFFGMFILLIACVSYLIHRLKIKIRYLNINPSAFKNEIRILIITLVAFCTSYLVRWIWDMQTFLHQDSWQSSYTEMMVQLLVFFFFDFLPFICIFVVHYKNFEQQKSYVKRDYVGQESQDMIYMVENNRNYSKEQ